MCNVKKTKNKKNTAIRLYWAWSCLRMKLYLSEKCYLGWNSPTLICMCIAHSIFIYLICMCIAHSIFIYMSKPPLDLGEGGTMGGQLPSKAHVNFRQFTAVLSVTCKLPCAVVNLNFHDNLQCRLLTKIPLFMQWIFCLSSIFLFRCMSNPSCIW